MPRLSTKMASRKKAAKCKDGNIGFNNERALVLQMKQKCNDEDPKILEGLQEDAADVVLSSFPDPNLTPSSRKFGVEEYKLYCDFHGIKIAEGGTHTPIEEDKLALYLHVKVLALSELSNAVDRLETLRTRTTCMLRHDGTQRSRPPNRPLKKIPEELTNVSKQMINNTIFKEHLPQQDTYNHFALIDEHVACMLRLDVGSEKWIERWNMFSTGLATGSRPGALGELRNWRDYFFFPSSCRSTASFSLREP